MAKPKYLKWLEPENLILLEGWARDGLTEEQIARNMGINAATLYRWKNDHCEICKAIKNGKEVADYIVESALFKSATGYDVEEFEEKVDNAGNVVPTHKTRHVNANVAAQIFWLKNRRRDKWRDNPDAVQDTSALDRVAEILSGIESNGIQ